MHKAEILNIWKKSWSVINLFHLKCSADLNIIMPHRSSVLLLLVQYFSYLQGM